MESEISNLKMKNSNMAAEISNLENKDSNLVSDVSNLKSKDSQLGSEVSNLKAKDTKLASEISSLVKNMEKLAYSCPSDWVDGGRLGCYYQCISNQSSLGLISPISPTSPGMDWVTITILKMD